MDYINLDRFEFVDEKNESVTLGGKVSRWRDYIARPRTGAGPAPIDLKKEYELPGKDPFLKILFESIGFSNPQMDRIISFHDRRLSQRFQIRKILYAIFSLAACLILALGVTGLYLSIIPLIRQPSVEREAYIPSLLEGVLIILLNLTAVLFTFVLIRMIYKIIETLTIRKFADSVCALTVAYLIVELSRGDVLIDTEKRASLIARTNDLARNTLFLTSRFASRSSQEQEWSSKHFRYMERYIRERERWIITPMETTLADLRRDFHSLAEIYITGNYGKFDWSKVTSPPETITINRRQRLLKAVPRFVGVILPLIFFGILLWQHPQLESIGLGTNIIALIFIAWLLLAIDATLKLGIVAGVINLAKEIKNLK